MPERIGRWLMGLPAKGEAVEPEGIPITSLAQFLAQFTEAELATCPPDLLPKFGPYGLEWPDVCHCTINGGEARKVHAVQTNCNTDEVEGVCCPDTGTSDHAEGCPFDTCPIGQCHPLCYQVIGHGEDLYCHCPCHG